jgi:hypothetical protein
LPATGWGLHLERFVRADVVVFAAELIEPLLVVVGGYAAAVERPFHAAMEPLHLALSLRMAYAGKMKRDALTHQPQA